MPELKQTGNFRGRIVEYGLSEAESGAIAVNVCAEVHEIYHEGEWHDWRNHGFTVRGAVWIVKKDGQLNKSQAEALCKHAGWNGQFSAITDGSWTPHPIGFEVGEDVYEGQTRYRLEWIKPYDYTPGGGNVDREKAQALELKYGGSLRAIAGNAQTNQQQPTGQPSKPAPQSQPASTPYSEPAPEPSAPEPVDDKEIPF